MQQLQAPSAAAGALREHWRSSPLQTHAGCLECLQMKFVCTVHNIFLVIFNIQRLNVKMSQLDALMTLKGIYRSWKSMHLLYTLQALILKVHMLSQIIQEHLKQRSVPAWEVICSLLPESLAAFGGRGAGNPVFICIYEQPEALVVL